MFNQFKFLNKFRLRILLIIPFVLQITVAIGLVSYLSFNTAANAVNNLSSQLRTELTARIERELKGYFITPHHINLLNYADFAQGTFNFENPTNLFQILQELKISPFLISIYCGTEQAQFIGAGLDNPITDKEIYFFVVNKSTQYHFHRYHLDSQGNKLGFAADEGPYSPVKRPWYKKAAKLKKPVWSDIYIDFTSSQPTITAATPVYDKNDQLLGVCGVDVSTPTEFREFLSSLKIGKTGIAFVMDKSGRMISSSTKESLTIGTGKETKLIAAINSSESLVQETAIFLKNKFTNFQNIQNPEHLSFDLQGNKQFVQVLPFNDGQGLDWLIVVSLPESDFMGEIYQNTKKTLLLTIMALIIAIFLGIFTTRWITDPIKRLTRASVAISNGNLEQNVPSSPIVEMETLANSFNSMAKQLSEYFNTLKLREQQLEDLLESYGRFVPHEYLQFLNKESILDVNLGDYVSKDMAIMFSDIRAFTTLSEKMTPQENFDFVNTYLSYVSPEIRASNGIIVKFLGDGLMAVFPQGADDAIASAIASAKKVQEYNQEREKLNLLPINVGIGIHLGNLMVGMIGESNRMGGDVLSDNVNLAARLEGLTKFYGVTLIISENVFNNLSDRENYHIRFLDEVIVKGRSEPIKIYDVLDAELESIKLLKLQTLGNFQLGLESYRKGNFREAKVKFTQVLNINPDDQSVILYLQRIVYLSNKKSLGNWSGVWTFETK